MTLRRSTGREIRAFDYGEEGPPYPGPFIRDPGCDTRLPECDSPQPMPTAPQPEPKQGNGLLGCPPEARAEIDEYRSVQEALAKAREDRRRLLREKLQHHHDDPAKQAAVEKQYDEQLADIIPYTSFLESNLKAKRRIIVDTWPGCAGALSSE